MAETWLLDTNASTASTISNQELSHNNGMGPLEQEPKQTVSVMEPGNRCNIEIDLMAHFAPPLVETTISTPHENLSISSSPSYFSMFEGTSHMAANATTESPAGTARPLKLHDDASTGLLVVLVPESNQNLSVMETGKGISTSSDLGTIPGTTIGEDDLSRYKKLEPLSSSSSLSSVSSSEDPSEMSANATSDHLEGRTGFPSRDEDSQLASTYSNENLPISSAANPEQHNYGLAEMPEVVSGPSNGSSSTDKSATQFPPVQVMERSGDSDSSPQRIPPYVFARTKSTAPMEWSTNSTESLFSIHMGNMSFTKDQVFLLGKSGELGKPGEISISGLFIDLSSNLPPMNISTEIGQKSVTSDEGSAAMGATAAETVMKVTKENEEDRIKASPSLAGKASPSASISASDGSTRSFAFPM